MFRCALTFLACLAAVSLAFVDSSLAQPPKLQANQMVKGTIKSVDVSKDVLVINQKIKNDVVDRELSIRNTTEFVVTGKNGKKEAVGNAGLKLLEGKEGSQVQVKCDKDVNVVKVTVMTK